VVGDWNEEGPPYVTSETDEGLLYVIPNSGRAVTIATSYFVDVVTLASVDFAGRYPNEEL